MHQESPHHSSQVGRISSSPKSAPSSPLGISRRINETQQSTPVGCQTEQETNDSAKLFQEIHGSLMVVAVLAAGATYQAGLSPPGGFWQESDDEGHIAGTPVLEDILPRRYKAFFYCNSTAFIMSLVIIILLMNSRFYNSPGVIKALKFTMILDLFGFMGAYTAGSCHELTLSIYLFVMMGGVFIYVISFARAIAWTRYRVHNNV